MKIDELEEITEIDIRDYIDFRENVKSNMEHPEWLGDFTIAEIKEALESESMKIWVYKSNNENVCSMMLLKSSEKSLQKLELNLEAAEVVDYGPMFVNPKFVGNGLQYQMLKRLDQFCQSKGYKYAASTVHPDNVFSIKNIEKDNFILQSVKEFKRGLRNIYLKKY